MELVGLGYTGWFVYRYLLFKVKSDTHYLSLFRCAPGFLSLALLGDGG
jgi:hypothetical protein